MRRGVLSAGVAGGVVAAAAVSVGAAAGAADVRPATSSPAVTGTGRVPSTTPSSRAASRPTPDPSPTAAPTGVVSAYTVLAAPGPTAFPEEQVTLAPIVRSPPPISAAQAYSIARGSGPLPFVADSGGVGTAIFYAYSNSATGTIDADGGTTLMYTSVPAWVFSFPLAHDLDDSVDGASTPGGQAFSTPTGSACSWITIVDASARQLIEAFQSCAG